MMKTKRAVALLILDGWGISGLTDGNAVAAAGTPVLKRLFAEYPSTELVCSGEAVGLPAGIMGNSEVGHLNIGAGRVVYQDLLRIDRSIEDRSFFSNPVFDTVMEKVRKSGGSLHLLGLVSDGGVHSQLTHLLALLDLAREKKVPRTRLHAVTDGRDTSPTGGIGYIRRVTEHMEAHKYGAIATICGRYFAMDRDKRWDRTRRAYQLYTAGEGQPATDPLSAISDAYARGETDEFIQPIRLEDGRGVIRDGDGLILFNFRADRMRQITRAFTESRFTEFDRPLVPTISSAATMTFYGEVFTLPVAFGPVHLKGILGEAVSREGIAQLRIAETEKYAHVTYFFNGGEETPFPGEDRFLVPSPREVPTYDFKPEMSAMTVTDEVLKRIETGRYGLIVLNFANMDMVGHTGVFDAAVKACKTVDACVGRIADAVRASGGALIITADHGNAEQMIDETGAPHTAHTTNPVPLILVDDARKSVHLKKGMLADIAPTVLKVMGIDPPEEMTGASLIQCPERGCP